MTKNYLYVLCSDSNQKEFAFYVKWKEMCFEDYQLLWSHAEWSGKNLLMFRKSILIVALTLKLVAVNTSAGLENREYGRRDPPRWTRGTLYPNKLALTSPTSGGRSVGIVR
jgi:hypothetical protein